MTLEAHETPARGLSKAHLKFIALAVVIAALLVAGSIGGQSRTPADNTGGIVQRQHITDKKETLRGLTGVEVVVENLRPEVEKLGLTRDKIRTDVELSLRRNGIRVLSQEENRTTPGMPYLYVNANVVTFDDSPTAGFSISVELKQGVILFRDQTKTTYATTWSSSMAGTAGTSNLQSIRDTVKEQVDIFSNDFLAVNPK